MISSNYQKHTSKNPLQQFLINRYYKKLQKLMPQYVKAVLDVGCGEGFLLRHLPPDVENYAGIDYSEKSVQLAKVQSSKLKAQNDNLKYKAYFQQADIYKLPFPNNTFDIVFCLEVLEHLEKYEKALQEIKRVAKKYVILSVPNEPWFQISNFLRGKYLSTWGNHPEHLNKWNPIQFQKLISEYFIIKISAFSFPWQIYFLQLKLQSV